jgi:subtilisin family serine protease/chitodextrinase
MRNPPILGTLRKNLILLPCAVVFSFLSAIQIASAQVLGNLHEKAPKRVIMELASGNSQDLIVVFDDKVAQKTTRELQSMTGLSSHHSQVIEHKAARYTEKKKEILSAFESHEAVELKRYSHLPVGFLRIHSKEALDRLLADPDVVGVYENMGERMFLAESLPLIGQPQAAALGYLGVGTAIAVLDTGVDYTKTAFGSCTAPGVPTNCKVVYAQDFAPSDGKLDDNGHGTNVAGILLGVAPGTKIVALDVFRSGGLTYQTDQISAINWVIANKSTYNIVAINMSFGGGSYSSQASNDPRKSVFDAVRAAGIIPVAAAGNEGYTNALAAPAAIPGVVSVGAVYDSAMGSFNWGNPLRCSDNISSADKVACFSNSASFLTLLAPGSQILAAGMTNGGTSQAAPHVAGAVAVLRSAYPTETLEQTISRLTKGVMVTDSRNDIAKPRLNLQMALALNASCTYSLSETSKSFSSISSSGSVAVTTGAGCTWSAASNTSNSDWITVTSGSSGSGSGSGTVNYSVSANDNIASRTGTITVAGHTYTVTQSGSVGAVSNILLNPGFEEGPVSWTDSPANRYPVITAYLNPTANNSWYAWLCGYNNCVDKLYQDVTVPADAQSAYVQFNYWITTDETSSATAYDTMTVRIYSPPNATTYTYWTLSNLNPTTGWVLSPEYKLSAFKGQTIRLQFAATTDSSFTTDFYVDNVALMVSGSTPDTQAPMAPTGLTATASSASEINLDWNASTDNVGVTANKVYRSGTLVATLGNVTTYRDTGLMASSSYIYTVSACDAAGNCSPQSAATSATTPAPPDTQPPTVPTGLTATVISSSHINLVWTASTDNVGVITYKIYSGGNLVAILGNVTSSSRTNTTSTTYIYTVSACDAAGNCSAQSTPASATTPAPPDSQPPTAPTGLTATAFSSSQINLSWNASTDNVGVTAYKITSSDGQTATLGDVTSYSHTGLRSSTAYSYTVAACDGGGNCSAQTTSASATTKAPPVKGDINDDGSVNLADAIMALQIVSGRSPSDVNKSADVNNNGQIGLEEALYILQLVAGLRLAEPP